MTTLLYIVVGSLGALFLWGFLAPRSQWRTLASWSHRDSYRNEPTGGAYILHRAVSVVGIVSIILSGVFVTRAQVEKEPPPPEPPTQAELIWGTPEPVVVNRVLTSVRKAPAGLVSQPILGYHGMTGVNRQPPYLFDLADFSMPQALDENGFIGVEPEPGLVALDSAKLVVRVLADPQCFPHAAIVRETRETVTLAVYYGRALPDPKNPPDDLNDCNVLGGSGKVSTLIPVPMVEPLGIREVRALDGTPIPLVGADD